MMKKQYSTTRGNIALKWGSILVEILVWSGVPLLKTENRSATEMSRLNSYIF